MPPKKFTQQRTVSLPSKEELDGILSQLMVPDNNTIKSAELRLKEISGVPMFLIDLLDRARSAEAPQVRQLAAVIARRKCVQLWGLLGSNEQEIVKSLLLHSLAGEQQHLVRRSIADVISAIAKSALPAGQWNDLLQHLFECSRSPNPEHREVALIVFTSLTDTIGDILRPHYQQLQQIFVQGLGDEAPQVRITALRAVGALVQWFQSDDEFELGSNLLPPLLQVAKQCIDGGDDDTVLRAFEMLIECVQFSFGTLERSLPMVVKFMLDVATSAGRVELGTREQAMAFVTELATYKAKILKKKNLITMILHAIFTLAAEPDGDIDRDEDDPPYTWAGATLDMLAVNLPSKQLVPSVLHHISTNIASADKYQRRGAIYVMGTCAEGCSEYFTQEITTFLPWLLQGLGDPEDVVRSTSCWALTQFVEFLQPEIAEHYEDLLPGIFQALHDRNPDVQRPACHALEEMCEMLEDKIGPYLEQLMLKMVELLGSDSNDMRELGISGIASAAGAAGELFRPYYPVAIQAVSRFMLLTDADDMSLRARATECGGVLVAALGREVCAADLPGFMQHALVGLQDPEFKEFSELREYTYSAFANLAGVLKEDLAPALPTLMPILFESCRTEDGVLPMVSAPGAGGAAHFAGVAQDSDDDDDEDDPRTVMVRTAVMDEKASAVHAVGAVAEGVGAAFLPYLDEALACAGALTGYFHEDVRQSLATAKQRLLMVSFRAHTEPMRAAAGPVAEQLLHPHTALLLDGVMAEYLRAMREDDDKETVAVTCEAIGALAPAVGAFCMSKFLPPLMQEVLNLFEGKAACQAGDGDDGEAAAEAEDEEDHDQVLIDAVADLLGSLASVWRGHFAPHFAGVFPAVVRYARAGRPPSDQLMAIGAVAEVCSHLGEACLPYIQPMLPVLAAGIADRTNPGIRRNSAFCCGVFCRAAPGPMAPYALQVLAGLQPLLAEDEDDEVRDNAVGAVARMLTGCGGGGGPAGAAAGLPTEALIGVLVENAPLEADEAENDAVAECLLAVAQAAPEALNAHLGRVVAILARLLAEERLARHLGEQRRAAAADFIRGLCAQYAGPMAAVVAGLPEEHRAWLAANVGC